MKTKVKKSTSDILDAVDRICRIEVAFQKNPELGDAEKEQAATDASVEAMMKEQDKLQEMILSILEQDRDTVLYAALDRLLQNEKYAAHGSLEDLIYQNASIKTVPDDQGGNYFYALEFIPVIVNLAKSDRPLVMKPEEREELALLIRKHWWKDIGNSTTEIDVDPMLWKPTEVFPMSFAESYKRNMAPAQSVLAERGQFPTIVETDAKRVNGGLRFIALWRKTLYPENFLDLESVITEQTSDDALNNAVEAWFDESSEVFHNLFGVGCFFGVPASIQHARSSGASLLANVALDIFLHNHASVFETYKNIEVFVTAHGNLSTDDVEHLRFSVTAGGTELIAGHTVYYNDWFGNEDAEELIMKLANALDTEKVTTNPGLYCIKSGPKEDLFFTTKGWVNRVPEMPIQSLH